MQHDSSRNRDLRWWKCSAVQIPAMQTHRGNTETIIFVLNFKIDVRFIVLGEIMQRSWLPSDPSSGLGQLEASPPRLLLECTFWPPFHSRSCSEDCALRESSALRPSELNIWRNLYMNFKDTDGWVWSSTLFALASDKPGKFPCWLNHVSFSCS